MNNKYFLVLIWEHIYIYIYVCVYIYMLIIGLLIQVYDSLPSLFLYTLAKMLPFLSNTFWKTVYKKSDEKNIWKIYINI